MPQRLLLCWLLGGMIQFWSDAVHAQPLIESTSFTKIADTSTAIPGGSGSFSGFGFAPSIFGGTVAFYGQSNGFAQQGIYLSDGQVPSVAVDLNDAIPDGTGTFTSLSNPAISAGTVAFRGFGNSSQQGIYTANGALAKIVDLSDTIPEGTGSFTGFSTPSISGGRVVLWGQGSNLQRGIYLHDGSLAVVADTATAIPSGSGNFTSFTTTPSISNDRVAFFGAGSASQRGIYTDVGGSLEKVVDATTAIPDGTGNFSNFQGNVGISGSDVGFFGSGASSQSGIYVDDGTLRRVADRSTAIPGASGNFLGFNAPAVSNANAVFEGFGGFGFGGIYADFGAGPEKIIDTADQLEGKTIERLRIGKTGFDGTQIVFFAEFTNGSEGIFLAEVTLAAPTLPSLSLPARAVLAAMLAVGVAANLSGSSGRARPKQISPPS